MKCSIIFPYAPGARFATAALAGMLLVGMLLCGPLLHPDIVHAERKIVRLTTTDWDPYIGQNMSANGYVAEVVREAFRRSGYETIIRFLPWARAVAQTRQGEWDGVLPVYDVPERREEFLLSSPLPAAPLGFFKRTGEKIRFTTLKDLKGLRIGVVRGYMNTEKFDSTDFLQKSVVNDDLSNIRRLLAHRIDLFVADKVVGYFLIRKYLPEDAGKIEFMEPPLENKQLFIAFSRKLADAEEWLHAFNKGLASMQADGSLEAIMKRHGFNDLTLH